jgi:ADP-ribose pyrophosphatase YjhB (NUDIX family)
MAKKKLKLVKTKAKRLRPCKEVSVMAWVQDSESRVLLVRQTAGQKLWTLPGGKVRPRESLEGALLREVFEETGLRAEADASIDIMDRPDRGTIMILYTIRILDDPPSGRTILMRKSAKSATRLGFRRTPRLPQLFSGIGSGQRRLVEFRYPQNVSCSKTSI